MSNAVRPLKKQEKPLVVWFRLYGSEKADMQAVAGRRRGAQNAVAMAGTLAEVARLKRKASGLSPEIMQIVAEAQRLDIDVRAVLKSAIKAA